LNIKSFIIESGLLKASKRLIRWMEARLFWYIFDARLTSSTPVFVYQMGKVASTTIYRSLQKVYPGIVLHDHLFGPNRQGNPDAWRIRRLYEHCVVNQDPLYIISLTREPIERNISAFFQNFERETGVPYNRSDFSLTELRDLFLENYNHNVPLNWFDDNIKANFGIDVYATPFPADGVATYSKDNFHLLVIRCEIHDEKKAAAIRDFLDLPSFEIERRNVGTNKRYAQTYHLFKERVRLPLSYISKMCDSKYFTHFYNEEFVESVRHKWNR
jgi:hypothetical protein